MPRDECCDCETQSIGGEGLADNRCPKCVKQIEANHKRDEQAEAAAGPASGDDADDGL